MWTTSSCFQWFFLKKLLENATSDLDLQIQTVLERTDLSTSEKAEQYEEILQQYIVYREKLTNIDVFHEKETYPVHKIVQNGSKKSWKDTRIGWICRRLREFQVYFDLNWYFSEVGLVEIKSDWTIDCWNEIECVGVQGSGCMYKQYQKSVSFVQCR